MNLGCSGFVTNAMHAAHAHMHIYFEKTEVGAWQSEVGDMVPSARVSLPHQHCRIHSSEGCTLVVTRLWLKLVGRLQTIPRHSHGGPRPGFLICFVVPHDDQWSLGSTSKDDSLAKATRPVGGRQDLMVAMPQIETPHIANAHQSCLVSLLSFSSIPGILRNVRSENDVIEDKTIPSSASNGRHVRYLNIVSSLS